MQVVYANQEFPDTWTNAIFLAGPTPRSKDVPSWRPGAIAYLESIGYEGVVFSPEPEGGNWPKGGDAYVNQAAWERRGLEMSDVIVFWVPRTRDTMLGLTTNVEFGRYVSSRKVVFGAPPEADSVRYLELMLKTDAQDVRHFSLEDTLQEAVQRCKPVLRTGGERCVPVHIWNTASFQSWYKSLVAVGNRLDDAKVLWHFEVGKKFVLSWVLQANIWVESEGRHKSNEYVFARSDISTILLFSKGPTTLENKVVLVREFRSPVRNDTGFVHELAGGSSFKPKDNPLEVAAHEVHEETGLIIPADRFKMHASRQMVATLSPHHAVLFSAELTPSEMAQAEALATAQTAHGVVEETERTYVEILTYGEILSGNHCDWSMLGMLAQVFSGI